MDQDDNDTELSKIFEKSREVKKAYLEGESIAEEVKLKKSPNDPRKYRELLLSNKMKVLLIQDESI